MLIILSIIAFVFAFYAPFYLKKNSGDIKPDKNMFEKFVDNDHGYPWSTNQKRKESYHGALRKKIESLNNEIKL